MSVLCQKELGLCRDKLKDEQKENERLNLELRSIIRNLKTLESENENLRNRVRQLESKNLEMTTEVQNLASENQNLKDALETCENDKKGNCKGPIDSILMFQGGPFSKLAVMTRGLSSSLSETSDEYKIGNEDKIITSFNKNGDVWFVGACGVIYQGIIHFFGGLWENQHFGFDEKRNFVKYENLATNFQFPQCSTFDISNSQSGNKEVVLLCFDWEHEKYCYQFADGKLTHFIDANESHHSARLGKYKDQLITVGGVTNQKTETLCRSYNGRYKWTLRPEYNFAPTGDIFDYSMVNVQKMGSHEEYLLLIGGKYGDNVHTWLDKVHKYNGRWSYFGKLQTTRAYHNSVFLDGRVFIIGGSGNDDNKWMKTEIWDISKSRFETKSTWPELNNWYTNSNNALIVPEYTNP